MRTHVKEAAASFATALALVAVIHGGIWFTLFGTPDLTVIGFPFHYFWLVAGGPIAMYLLYWVYYRFITTYINAEKEQIETDFDTEAAVAADGGATEESDRG